MRLAISNIAWDVAEDEAIASLLHRYNVDAIDIVPGKYFPEPSKAKHQDIARVKIWWAERGIEITGMQALFLGTSGLNMFGSSEIQMQMLQHLDAVCHIGAGIGAKRLVFGAPKNRDRSGLSDQETMYVAVAFFMRLGEIALSHGVVICLEPTPTFYGANFMTTSAETLRIVEQVAHPSIQMQLDTGVITINGEDAETVLKDCAPRIGHIHASEPDLLPLGSGGAKHSIFAEVIKKYLPKQVVTIEMLASKNEPHTLSIERALIQAILYYRDIDFGTSV